MTMTIPPKPLNSNFNDDQWEAINSVGTNILVAASAGSGKTTVLIERILRHIQADYAMINELLVVTFTESAANEMKVRMNQRLKEAVNETTDTQQQHYLLQQIKQVPTAHIRTLHSFCLQIIQNFFYLKDYNPSFKLMTDNTQQILIQEEVWRDLIGQIMENNSKTVDTVNRDLYLNLLNTYGNGRSDNSLYDIVISLYKFSMSHPEPIEWLNNVDNIYKQFNDFSQTDLYQSTLGLQVKEAGMTTSQLLEEAIGFLNTMGNETIEKYDQILNDELQQVNQVLTHIQNKDLKALIDYMPQVQFKKWPSNSKKSEDYELVSELKELRDQAKKIMTEDIQKVFHYDYQSTHEIESQVQPYVKGLGNLTLLFIQALKEQKDHLNVIDYSDLEHMTLDILTDYDSETEKRVPSIAATYYQDLFKEVLVDEYQDINEIQATILSFLSHEQANKTNGNMFMVGDVKQSIYGFRMAEPSLFLEKYLNYQKTDQGHLIVLNKNYRSRDEVLQFTNFIFERIMDSQIGEMDYGEQEKLITGNHDFLPEPPDPSYNVDFLLYESDQEESEDSSENNDLLTIDSSLEAEAHLIVQDIQTRIENNEQIYDKETKQLRPLQLKDIVILTSTRKPFITLQTVFDQYEIPLVAQKVENYFQRQEVQVMIALLRIIDNPMQDIPFAAVLRSYFVGLTDQELSEIRIHQLDGSYYEATLSFVNDDKITEPTLIALQTKVDRFLTKLSEWRQASKIDPLVEIIWSIYQETNYLDYVSGLSNGNQRQANLHALYERAQDFSESSFKGINGFINYIEQIMRKENDLAEPVLVFEDEDFVRVMTVHASKGLEFPYVYLMNTNKQFNLTDARSVYIASKHYGLSSDLYLKQPHLRYFSLVKEAMRIEKVNQLKAEEMRKLYVALTRCEQQLVIVGSVKSQARWEEELEDTRRLTPTSDLLANAQKRRKANSWLKWMQQAIAVSETSHTVYSEFNVDQINIQFFKEEDLTTRNTDVTRFNQQEDVTKWLENVESQVANHSLDLKDDGIQTLAHLMNHQYKYRLATNTSSYQSVSELKRLYEEPRIEKISYFEDRRPEQNDNLEDNNEPIQAIRYTEDTFSEPQFMQGDTYSVTDIGTFTHLVLQELNFTAFQTATDFTDQLDQQIQHIVETGKLTVDEAKTVSRSQIETFLQSSLATFLINHADRLKREQAFSLLTSAKDLFRNQVDARYIEELDDDQLLVHGVIDSYVELDDRLVLLDYKTDRFKAYVSKTRQEQIEAIVSKYKFQLSLYQQALSISKQKPVEHAYLVLLDFNESIEVTDLYEL